MGIEHPTSTIDPPGDGMPDPSERRLGRYRLLEKLNSHGQGVVYTALQDSPQRVVAVKVLKAARPARHQLALFRQEIEVLGRLQHPGIATVFEGDVVEEPDPDRPGETKSTHFIAMEFIAGASYLTNYLKQSQVTLAQALEKFAQVADALQYVHDRNTIHRDIKPSNVLVDASGRVKLIDFGLAWDHSTGSNPALAALFSRPVGTPAYMSPEVCQSPDKVTPQADIYGLGLMMVEYLLGEPPVVVTTFSEPPDRQRIIDGVPPAAWRRLSTLPGPLFDLLRRACNPLVAGRYESAGQLAGDLRRLAAGRLPVAAGRATWAKRVRYSLSRLSRYAVVLLPVCAVVAAVPASLFDALQPQHGFFDMGFKRWITSFRSAAPPLRSTRIVLGDLPSLGTPEIAAAAGYPPYRSGDIVAGRYPMARMVERLARGGARAIALDYRLSAPRPDRSPEGRAATTELARVLADLATRPAQPSGSPEVLAVRRMWASQQGMDPELLPNLTWANAVATSQGRRVVSIDTACFSSQSGTLSVGFCVEAAGAYYAPRRPREYRLPLSATGLMMIAPPAFGTSTQPTLPALYPGPLWLFQVSHEMGPVEANPEFDLGDGDWEMTNIADLPGNQQLAAVTLDPLDVLYRWDLARLKAAVDGKLVVIGDSTERDRFDYADGPIQGPVVNAVAVDRLINDEVITVPPNVPVLGLRGIAYFLAAGALAGGAIARWARWIWVGPWLIGTMAAMWPACLLVALYGRIYAGPWSIDFAVLSGFFLGLVFLRPTVLQRVLSRRWAGLG